MNSENDVALIRSIEAVPSILDVVCKVTGMGFAAVARVTEDRWVACEVLDNIDFGLKPGGELRIETTICNEIRDSREAVIIDHVAEDTVFGNHHTPALYGFQSYISMPIVLSDGRFFGTLCAIDPRPMRLNTSEIVGMFKLFAELIAVHVDARSKLIVSERNLTRERRRATSAQEQLAASQNDLLDAQAVSSLREQFIAVLGHDLRNPLAAVQGGTHLLMRRIEDEQSRKILQMMAASIQRMSGLITNVLDFARGRLGGGLTLEKRLRPLEPLLTTVIDEIRTAWPNREIQCKFDLTHDFRGDHARLGQLLSNLLGNAVAHGAETQPIRVEASSDHREIKVSVINGGAPIPTATLKLLFQPFQRGKEKSSLQGLGLGLYIASQIAQAHEGTLDVVSNEFETSFTFTAPVTGQ